MTLSKENIISEIQSKFNSDVNHFEEPYGLLTFTATSSSNIEILQFLYNHEIFQFRFLTDICGVHYPDVKKLAVVYHLHSLVHNFRLRMKVFLSELDPRIRTATTLFEAANWMERETYDFFGIVFEGHPNLKRILNVDDMVAFPLRKEYPLEDPNRIDKNDDFFGR